MSTFKKHVGRISNTDRRCVVVYMQIPGNEENALVIDTDALPDRFHDALIDVIDSTEGQQTDNLHTLLSRRVMPDIGLDMMNTFHTYGLLRAVPIDNIIMFPAPNSPCPLRTLVDYMNGTQTTEVVEQAPLANRHLENQKNDREQGQRDIALTILQQAADLEQEAAKKREQAYRMVPSLRPVVDGNPVAEATDAPQVTASPAVIEASVPAQTTSTTPVDALPDTSEVIHVAEEPLSAEGPIDVPNLTPVIENLDPDLPADVLAALHAAQAEFHHEPYVSPYEDMEVEGNQVDTSDDAVQAFLDRVAHREDKADKELQESLKPKAPVGRPRKDGLPAGTKPADIPPPPKKRGRPPKAKK